MGHKILFISDIHFGVKGNSEVYLNIIENFFLSTLAKVIKERSITDVRILGDLFDNRNSLNIRTINTVIKVFRWYQHNMPSVKWKVLIGNHDIYYHNRLDINSIEIIREFPNVELIGSVTEEKIDGYKIISFPWLVTDTEPETKFKEIIAGDERYDLCLGHFEINGFEVTSGINHEGGVDSGKFKNFQRVFTGHFHLRRSNGHISYLGCPYPITWADYGDEKGIHIYDLETRETEFIPNKDSPIFVRVNVEDLLKKNMEKIAQIKGNFVRMVIDKKYPDQVVVKALSKIEGFGPKRLDVENNSIEEFDGEVSATDISKLNDPLSFLSEYIKNIENTEVEVDKKDFTNYVSSLYATLTKDKD
jgi:DNA repair exonuclease SbcCD nuclease subunit